MPDLTPVVYRNPYTGEVTTMPTEMVKVHNYNFLGGYLNLEDAARIAHKRDEENAVNFLLSAEEACLVLSNNTISEGTPFDLLTIQPPM